MPTRYQWHTVEKHLDILSVEKRTTLYSQSVAGVEDNLQISMGALIERFGQRGCLSSATLWATISNAMNTTTLVGGVAFMLAMPKSS